MVPQAGLSLRSAAQFQRPQVTQMTVGLAEPVGGMLVSENRPDRDEEVEDMGDSVEQQVRVGWPQSLDGFE